MIERGAQNPPGAWEGVGFNLADRITAGAGGDWRPLFSLTVAEDRCGANPARLTGQSVTIMSGTTMPDDEEPTMTLLPHLAAPSAGGMNAERLCPGVAALNVLAEC